MMRRVTAETSYTASEELVISTANYASNAVSLVGSGFIVLSLLYLARRCVSLGTAAAHYHTVHSQLSALLSAHAASVAPSDLCRRSKRIRGDLGLLEWVHYRLVFCTSCADCLHSISQALGDPQDKSASCYTQAIVSQFAITSSVGFVVCIAITLWGTFVHKWPLGDQIFERRLFKRYCNGVLGASFVAAIIPLWGDHYGESGAWCWIDNSEVGEVMRFATLYIPIWLAISAICVMYHQLIKKMDKLLSSATELESPNGQRCCCAQVCSSIALIVKGDPSRQNDLHFVSMLRVIRRLSMYPMVLIFCWSMPTVHRLHSVFSDHLSPVWLVVVASSFSNCNGMFNAMVYGFNPNLRTEIKTCCCGDEGINELEEGEEEHSVLGEEDNLKLDSERDISSAGVGVEMRRQPSDSIRAQTGPNSAADERDVKNPLYTSL